MARTTIDDLLAAARRHLKRLKAGYRRTSSTLKHKQDPAKAERAGRVLANLKAKAAGGAVKLYYLDECGFAPTLPTGYSWTLPGERRFVRYEAPQGRRVNALAAYFLFALPAVMPEGPAVDNWQSSAWTRRSPGISNLPVRDSTDEHFD